MSNKATSLTEDLEFVIDYMNENGKTLFCLSVDGNFWFETRKFDFSAHVPDPETVTTPKRLDNSGYVYLLLADNELYKIGKSKYLTKRIFKFGVKLPVKVSLVCAFRSIDYSDAEKSLHERYKEKRDHGEWFRLSKKDIRDICHIKDYQL
jgi:hypothetical protein